MNLSVALTDCGKYTAVEVGPAIQMAIEEALADFAFCDPNTGLTFEVKSITASSADPHTPYDPDPADIR